jgi:GT2 family glycosyltransferase
MRRWGWLEVWVNAKHPCWGLAIFYGFSIIDGILEKSLWGFFMLYVGIVTYNSLSDLPACLAAIRAQTYPHLRIGIWDNASTDSTVPYVQENHPDITLIPHNNNVGFGVGHNGLINHFSVSYTDAYLCLNPDAKLSPDYASHLMAGLSSSLVIGWAVGKLCLPNEKDTQRYIYSVGHALRRGGYAFNIGHGMLDSGQFDEGRTVFGAPAAAALYSGRLIADFGGQLFDPRLFLYGEDTELDWRAVRAGWECRYVPTAVAEHRGSQPIARHRDMAVTHRYLACLRHAYLPDLLCYNLPLIMGHSLARLIFTPRRGFAMLLHLLRDGPSFLRARQTPRVPRKHLNTWFGWSARQPTMAPKRIWERVRKLR